MRPKHVLTALAIFAVTGAVSVPNSLAVAWRLDVSDRRGSAWDQLIHTVGDPQHALSTRHWGTPSTGPSLSQIVVSQIINPAIQGRLVHPATKIKMTPNLLTF